MEINVLDSQGKVSGKASLPEAIAQAKPNRHLVHEVVTAYLSNQRKGTHATLTRGNVTGGGKKPWKQKHTGRARAGTSRSPLWRKGGIIFGPHPRSYRVDLPQVKVKAVLNLVLSAKAESGNLVVAEIPRLEAPKTKKVVEWLKALSLPQKCLVVMVKQDQIFKKASRNLVDFQVMEWKHLHPYQVMNSQKVVLTPEVAGSLS